MSFSADWLALRADADRRARNPDLAAELAEWMYDIEPARILDLGAGTGASLHALSPLLGASQTWVLADNDKGLLDAVVAPGGVALERRVIDLGGELSALFEPAPDMVTASAFFDLCGRQIADRIVAATVAAGAAFYTALSYDGREDWRPDHPLDAAVLAAFCHDQRRDKGLGPALGPDATDHLRSAFEAEGYGVMTGPSDWVLSQAEDADLIAALARGSADAVAPALGRETAAEWHARRAQATHVTIGHQDLLAVPRR